MNRRAHPTTIRAGVLRHDDKEGEVDTREPAGKSRQASTNRGGVRQPVWISAMERHGRHPGSSNHARKVVRRRYRELPGAAARSVGWMPSRYGDYTTRAGLPESAKPAVLVGRHGLEYYGIAPRAAVGGIRCVDVSHEALRPSQRGSCSLG